MRAIDVSADPVADRTPDEYVRKKMIAPGEARHACRGCKSVSTNLDKAVMPVFVCYDSRQ